MDGSPRQRDQAPASLPPPPGSSSKAILTSAIYLLLRTNFTFSEELLLGPGAGRLIVGGGLDATVKMSSDYPALMSSFEIVLPPGYDVGAHVHARGEEVLARAGGDFSRGPGAGQGRGHDLGLWSADGSLPAVESADGCRAGRAAAGKPDEYRPCRAAVPDDR